MLNPISLTEPYEPFRYLLHNLGVALVGFGIASMGRGPDVLLGISRFHSIFAIIAGWLLVAAGFSLRVWATFLFYASSR